MNHRDDSSTTPQNVLFRLFLCLIAVGFVASGCASFGHNKDKETKKTEKTAFDKARGEQSDLAAFTASAGRSNPKEEKKVHPGQTFLLSSKAKEIYQNTER